MKKKPLLHLLAATKPYLKYFMFGILGTCLLSGLDAFFAWAVKPLMDKGIINRDPVFINWLPVIVLLVFLSRGFAGFCSRYFIERVARHVIRDFRGKLHQHFLRLPSAFYDLHPNSKLLAMLLYNVEQLAQACSASLVTAVREGAFLIGLVVVMFNNSWQLSLLFFIIGPGIAWVVQYFSKRMRGLSASVQTSIAKLTQSASESIAAYQLIRLFGGQAYEAERFARVNNEARNKQLKITVNNAIHTAAIQILVSIPIALVLILITHRILDLSAGAFTSVLACMIMILRPLRRITSINSDFQRGIAGAVTIFDVLDTPLEDNTATCPPKKNQGVITFQGVHFSYAADGLYALKGVDSKILPGKTTAIVGPSGAGKTSLVQVLLRFYPVTRGDILIGDASIKSFDLAAYRQQFSVVSQDTFLFNDTVAHNITYPNAASLDEEALIKAAEQAQAMSFISQLKEGFETQIGDQGHLLSGGQRQRLALARALYHNAPILILDEATSALDNESEQAFQQCLEVAALQELKKTVVVIAHRLSTIKNADHIIVMDEGRVTEQGNHEELLASHGLYRALYQANVPQ